MHAHSSSGYFVIISKLIPDREGLGAQQKRKSNRTESGEVLNKFLEVTFATHITFYKFLQRHLSVAPQRHLIQFRVQRTPLCALQPES